MTSFDCLALCLTDQQQHRCHSAKPSCIVLTTFPLPALPPQGPDLLITLVNYWLPLHMSRPLGADNGCCASVALPFLY